MIGYCCNEIYMNKLCCLCSRLKWNMLLHNPNHPFGLPQQQPEIYPDFVMPPKRSFKKFSISRRRNITRQFGADKKQP